jgi:hypothetical protein
VNQRAIFDYLKEYPGVADKDWVGDRPKTEATLRMSVDSLPLIMHFLAMATQLTHDVPSRSGDEWFAWFELFEIAERVPQNKSATKQTFLRQLMDLARNDRSGVSFKRTTKTRTYSIDGEEFAAYAASLGLCDAPSHISYVV